MPGLQLMNRNMQIVVEQSLPTSADRNEVGLSRQAIQHRLIIFSVEASTFI